MSHALQWPTKGSPAPTVRGPNLAESLLTRIQQIIRQAPLNAEYLAILQEIEAGLGAVVGAVDPDGQKQSERLALINAAVAKGPAGIPDLLAYIYDKPSHPDDTTELAMWNAIEQGYDPEQPADGYPSGPVETSP